MRRNRRKCVLRYLAALAAESAPDPTTYDVDPDHEMSGFIHFKSEQEVKDLENGIRRRIRRGEIRTTLPRSPDISEEEFESIQRRVTRKTAAETLDEYRAETEPRRAIPEEVLEATAEDLQSEDEFSDSSSESEEELPARLEDSDDCGRNSRIDFVRIVHDDEAASDTSNSDDAVCADSTIRSRVQSSALRMNNPASGSVGESYSRPFSYDEGNSLISGFYPHSCSTSIGHESLNQSRAMDFENIPETSPVECERPCDRTIVPHADSPSSSSSNSTLKSSGGSPGARHPRPEISPEVSPSGIYNRESSLDRTPSTMMRQCNLGSESSYSCPERRRRETPLAKRLRQLGLIDSSCNANSYTPKRRKLANARRFVQVYGTPQRKSEFFQNLFQPTADLAELVKFRVVEKDPFRMSYSLKPSRLEDRF